MIRRLKKEEYFYIKSMGKAIRVLAISDNVCEANKYLKAHKNEGVIAEFAPLIFIANLYDN